MAKISGPLLDRIDIHIEVPAVPFRELSSSTPGTSSAQMREHVVVARTAQRGRFVGSRTRHNGQMSHRQIRSFCQLDPDGHNLLKATITELGLSARAHDKILRVARTIADLDQADRISPAHVSEAINYRMLDRQMWT
jgi:magnesium chelatase family protein